MVYIIFFSVHVIYFVLVVILPIISSSFSLLSSVVQLLSGKVVLPFVTSTIFVLRRQAVSPEIPDLVSERTRQCGSWGRLRYLPRGGEDPRRALLL
jgi:hypothetical protein